MFQNGKKIASIESKMDLLIEGVRSMHQDAKDFHKAYHDDKDIINARINRRVKTKNAIISITILISVLGLLLKGLPYAAKLIE
jgi:hypothetical protein